MHFQRTENKKSIYIVKMPAECILIKGRKHKGLTIILVRKDTVESIRRSDSSKLRWLEIL